jgi:hypothetical protein
VDENDPVLKVKLIIKERERTQARIKVLKKPEEIGSAVSVVRLSH